jgi:hypothetical protein
MEFVPVPRGKASIRFDDADQLYFRVLRKVRKQSGNMAVRKPDDPNPPRLAILRAREATGEEPYHAKPHE